ncbi:ATP-binding protein [Paenibacillus abyssi]|uniref:histidine kinase n=1 Tax=Paenibacillus abyssi TaxID=1340531 RepID=A0A917CQ68_9BACL|nr:ATP-binding protein [Paenibacillus abyssi]GGF95811.1 hypothetical protein GCM10010916_11430 [Paenibacillus abyssi]
MPVDHSQQSSFHPENEWKRIKALQRYQILDTPPDGAFDRITALAAQLLNVPIAIVSLVDTDRIWFKSHHGLSVQEIDRDPGLCASAILEGIPYVLTDASIDPRSLSNPLVAGEMGFRFYAGIPLNTHDSYNLGVLCVIDLHPRTISDQELNILKTLSQIVMDEMELRLAVRSIDRLNKEKELLIQSLGEGIYGFDQNLNTTIWNQAAEKMTGFSSEEMLNRNSEIILHNPKIDGASYKKKEFPIYQSFKDGVVIEVAEDIFWRKDGTSFPVEYVSTPIVQEGQVTGAVVIFKNIEKKKQLNELWRRADKLKTVGQLAAGVAHEIRNPLTTLKGFLQILSKDSDNQDYFNIMKEELLRIESITSEFLVLSQPQAVQLEKKAVVPLLLRMKKLLKYEARLMEMSIELHFEEHMPSIYCDEQRLTQVFINVVKNAMEAMQKRGIVSIQCKTVDHKVLIRFIDHGCGIAADRLKHLGEPFYSTKEKGTGLGLMMSYKIVQEHNGEILIHSEVDNGTTVDIYLPAYSPVMDA